MPVDFLSKLMWRNKKEQLTEAIPSGKSWPSSLFVHPTASTSAIHQNSWSILAICHIDFRKRSCAKLTSSECTRDNAAPCAGASSSKDQSTPLSIRLFDVVDLERQSGAAGKGECDSHVNLEAIPSILRRDIKK